MLWMSLLLLGNPAMAADEVPAVCAIERDTAQARVELDFTPDYFFKPIPQQGPSDTRRDVSVISPSGNVVMNMNDGSYRSAPGPFDAVPTPDGQVIITPGLNFYDRDGVSSGNPRLLLADGTSNGANSLRGVYHSSGVLPGSTPPNRNYRVITDTLTEQNQSMNTLMYKDFSTRMGPDGPKFGDNPQPSKPLCPNLGDAPYKLPMLSKDGRQLAAFDVTSGTTKIFDVVQSGGQSRCNLKRDLGFATGKVEFSPDGSKITFAADTYPTDPEEVHWYGQPAASKNFQVYVVDMEEDSIQRISNQPVGNSYYPSFWGNDTVAYMEQSPNGQYSIVQAPVSETAAVQLASSEGINGNCAALAPEFVAATALGSLWTRVCEGTQAREKTLQGLAFTPLSLDGDDCRALVREQWPQYQAQLRASQSAMPRIRADFQSAPPDLLNSYYQRFVGLSESDLAAACPQGADERGGATVVSANTDQQVEAMNPLVRSCSQCHGPGSNRFFDFANPRSLAANRDRILEAVESEYMPMGTDLKPTERAAILDYIRSNIP
jgi:mono/diheme cytochrome c family protein